MDRDRCPGRIGGPTRHHEYGLHRGDARPVLGS
jgi:hypothetical protein